MLFEDNSGITAFAIFKELCHLNGGEVMVGARRHNQYNIFRMREQWLLKSLAPIASNNGHTTGRPVRPADVVESLECLLGIGAEVHYEHLVLV